MNSLRDGCYKQLKKCKLCPTKTQKTDDRTVCSFRSNSCISVSFQLKAEKIITITSYSYR